MKLPTITRLHGDIPQLLNACDVFEHTHHVLWATAPGNCPGHPTCFRITVIGLRRRPTTPERTTTA
ncbi:hypothetical protein [Actinoplanes sp. NPDC023714]|uniref:hypothetical protein n=1 Tax=Actinoplanes sp. NPDC023714 TaxID=3154322 RepID=UPI0033F9970F